METTRIRARASTLPVLAPGVGWHPWHRRCSLNCSGWARRHGHGLVSTNPVIFPCPSHTPPIQLSSTWDLAACPHIACQGLCPHLCTSEHVQLITPVEQLDPAATQWMRLVVSDPGNSTAASTRLDLCRNLTQMPHNHIFPRQKIIDDETPQIAMET